MLTRTPEDLRHRRGLGSATTGLLTLGATRGSLQEQVPARTRIDGIDPAEVTGMPSRRTIVSRVLLTAFMALALVAFPASVEARETAVSADSEGVAVQFRAARGAGSNASSWCADEFESLKDDVCYINGRKSERSSDRRTLVIWLHGVIAKGTNWSHNHQRMLARVAKYGSVEMLFPRGELGPSVYAWPGTVAAQEKSEQELINQWMAAKSVLEKREDRKFDDVFVFGFSSGAYFTSSLAMRGRLDVDGYAVFAGGQSMPAAATPASHFAPVFVGVCANDSTTAAHSRAFAGALATAGIPRMVSEQKVGHDLSEVHFLQALSFLRSKAKPRVV
jgi:predicted esterase